MEEKPQSNSVKYFAAANSYKGFISYFDRILRSEDFDRIYVLKGGPGTGKSSFMKKIASRLKENECEIQEIHCSSDPQSLDGIIAQRGDKKIAVIDGTAPHERDAIIPGAIDEIINLGDSWDSRYLIGRRSEILSIANEKSSAYKTAYSYLKAAGEVNDFIVSTYMHHFNKIEAKNKAEQLLKDASISDRPKETVRLISSFGRYGEFRLDAPEGQKTKKITVGGKDNLSCIFLNACEKLLMERGTSLIHFPLALDPALTDAIYLPECDCIITRSSTGDINTEDFLSDKAICYERVKKAEYIKSTALEEAARWFGIASELHFELEQIYGMAMDFGKNDEIFSKKIAEIENIFELNR